MTRRIHIPPIIVIGILFFIFGFITWLGSVLIPYLQIACRLSRLQSYLVTFSFYISYMLMALPASFVLKKTGFRKGMSAGLALMAFGALLFLPASATRQYWVFLAGLFFQGAGLTLLQTAANPYVTILGPKASAARRIGIMGICNGIAGVSAPLLLGSVILKDTEAIEQSLLNLTSAERDQALQALASRVMLPYTLIMLGLTLLAIMIRFATMPEVAEEVAENDTNESFRTAAWQFPHLLLGVLTLFLYVGVEVISVDTITGYAAFTGKPLVEARYFASFTLLNMLIGYVVGIVCVPRFVTQERALLISAGGGLLFTLCALASNGLISVVFIALLGLSNAMIWPSIWPLAINGLGQFTKTGSSLLVMAIGGGALLPLAFGYLADIYNPHHAYTILLPCYLMILYYATNGHKAGLHSSNPNP